MDKRIFFSISNKLYKKELDKKTLLYSIKTMEREVKENPDNIEYLKLLANLYIENEEYYKAQKIFLKMIEIDETCPTTYYGLFKIDLFIDDDESLLYDLGDFEYFHKNNSLKLDLYYDLTNLYLDVKEGKDDKNYEFKYDGILISNKIKDQEIEKHLKETINHLNNKDYNKALKSIKICIDINNKKHCMLSIYPLYLLIDKICNCIKSKILYNELEKQYLDNNDYDNFIKIFESEINNDYKSSRTYEYLRNIDIMIDLGYREKAKQIITIVKSKIVGPKNIKILKYLENKIKDLEDMDYSLLETNEYVKLYEQKEEYQKALNLYFHELKKTNKNIYNYYIGILLFKMEEYGESYYYFNKYIEEGGLMLSDALLYMSVILSIHKNFVLAINTICRCKNIYLFKNLDYNEIITETTHYFYHDPTSKSKKEIIKLTLDYMNHE